MKCSQEGLELIKKFEGCKLKSYKCPAGVWTIGYGHTEDIKEGDGEYDGTTPANFLIDVCAGSNSEDMAPGIVGYRSVCVVEAMLESSKSGNVVNLL